MSKKSEKLESLIDLMKSGYAGTDRNGSIVDRREYPDAVPVSKNKLMGNPKPVLIKDEWQYGMLPRAEGYYWYQESPAKPPVICYREYWSSNWVTTFMNNQVQAVTPKGRWRAIPMPTGMVDWK